ncbi:MAG TPA: oligosaccharide flippase family protein [Candidatus Limnocylindrales bacterium]|nr:oligosaccharide flippase family protein [Candidatus Limnocylindrales bacterium]
MRRPPAGARLYSGPFARPPGEEGPIARIATSAGLRGLVSSVAGYGLATAVSGIVGLAVVPAYTRALGASAYGEYQAAAAVFTLVTGCCMVGLDSAIAVLMPDHVSGEARGRLVSSLLLLASLTGLLAALVLFVGGSLAGPALLGPGAGGLLALGALVAGPSVLQNVAQAALRNLTRPGGYLAAAIAAGVGVLAVGLPLVLGGAGPAGAVAGLAAGAICGAAAAVWGQRDLLRRAGPDPRRIRALLRIGLPLLPAAVAAWIVSVSDRLLLTQLASLSDVGLYAAAAQIATVPNLGIAAFMLGWTPFALRVQRAPDAPRLYAVTLSLFAAGGAIVTLLTLPLGVPVLGLISGPEFAPGGQVVWLLVGSAFAYGGYVMLNVGLMVARRTELIGLVTGSAAGVNVLLNLVLIPGLGYVGAGIATLAAYLVSAGALYVLGQRALPLPYEPLRLLAIVGGTLAAGMLALAMPSAVLRWLVVLVAAAGLALASLGRLRTAVALVGTTEAAIRQAGSVDRDDWTRPGEPLGPA